jgi:phage terminase large subunit
MMRFTKVFWQIIKAAVKFKYIILKGGSRSSKSHSVMQSLWLKANKKPDQIIIMSALTRGITLKNIVRPLKLIAGESWNADKFNKSEMTYEVGNGSVIYFMSMDKEESFIGVKSTDAYFDEANLSSYAGEIISQVATRCSGNIYLAFNPSRRPEFLEQLEARTDSIILHSTWRDNEFLEQTIIDEILTRSKLDEVYNKVYNLGQYAMDVKEAIYNNWEVTDFWPDRYTWRLFGADWGFASDATTLIEGRLYEGKLYLKEHVYGHGMSTDDIAKAFKKAAGRERIVADNSELRLINELNAKGLNITKTKKYAGSILDGIRLMQSVQLMIHSDSINIVREIEVYRWKKVKGILIDEPADRQSDHTLDPGRYICLDKLRMNAGKYSYK